MLAQNSTIHSHWLPWTHPFSLVTLDPPILIGYLGPIHSHWLPWTHPFSLVTLDPSILIGYLGPIHSHWLPWTPPFSLVTLDPSILIGYLGPTHSHWLPWTHPIIFTTRKQCQGDYYRFTLTSRFSSLMQVVCIVVCASYKVLIMNSIHLLWEDEPIWKDDLNGQYCNILKPVI